jgi:type VI secretion system secreted protein Hcp
MAHAIFLSIDGGKSIKGNTTVTKHKDKIEVQSFNYGVAHPYTGNESAGERSHSDVSVSKVSDTASAELLLACIQGTVFKEVKFEFYRDDRTTTEQAFSTLTLTNAVVTSFQTSGSVGDGSPGLNESLSFGFAQMHFEILKKSASDKYRTTDEKHT